MPGKQRKNPVTDDDIVNTYAELRSAYRVADRLGIGDTTVYRVLLKRGVDRTGLRDYRSSITRFVGQEQEIREWYEAGETLEQIATRLGGASDYSIKHAVRRAGGTIRPNPIPTLKPGELERIVEMNATGLSQLKISLGLGRSQSFISRAMRRNGIDTLRKSGLRKGGRFITGHGYVRVMVDAADPMASLRNNSGHALEHRLVMSRVLGRPLLPTETVHHINGDKQDNRPENLQLRQGKHGKGIVMCCLDCGSRRIGAKALED